MLASLTKLLTQPVMAALALLSVLALALILERGWFWAYEAWMAARYSPASHLAALRAAPASAPAPTAPALARVLARAASSGRLDPPSVTAAVALEDLVLRRGLLLVESVIAAAPMLGILGTVLGLMGSFEGLGAAGRDPRAVVAGLSSALETTAAGLTIALAGMLPTQLLQARADHTLLEVEQQLAGLGLAGPGAGSRDD